MACFTLFWQSQHFQPCLSALRIRRLPQVDKLGEQLGRAHAEGGAELVQEAEKRAKAAAAACARKVSHRALAEVKSPTVPANPCNKNTLLQCEQASHRGVGKPCPIAGASSEP